MNIINNNPFRILGIPITASEREIAKQINTLATYAEMGKTKSFETDFSILSSSLRTPEVIEEAKKQIEQSESKLLYSLFWLWKNNSVDELAFEVLKEGNTSKAIEIWEKSVFINSNKIYKQQIIHENLIKSFDFDDEDNENHSVKKNGAEYIIERKKPENKYSFVSALAAIDYGDNWSIECETSWESGIENNSYGILFGKNEGNFYFFGISANGNYTFNKVSDWVFRKCIEWTSTTKINIREKNHLQIKKTDNTLTFYVNGYLVNSFSSEPFFGKYFGFVVNDNQKIIFKKFKFCKLTEDDIYGEGINVTTKNFSSLKNLSTLYLILAANNGAFQIDYFRKGIALAKKFFTTENIEDYSRLIAGEKYNYNSETILHFYISGILDLLKDYLDKPGGISTSQLFNLFSTFPIEAKQFLNIRFVSKQIQNIEGEIDIAQYERKKSAITAANTGKKLVTNTKEDIVFLKNVLGENDFQYQIIADKLCLEIVQSGIDFFNITKSDEIYLSEYEFATSIAVTDRVKEKARENLDSCKDWIKNKFLYNCWFCGTKPPENNSEFKTTIYKETSRSYFPRRSVQFKYLPVSIPRCSSCKNIHDNSSSLFVIIIIACTIIGLIIGINADGMWFLGLIIGAAIGWGGGEILKSQLSSRENIKSTSSSTIKDYPSLSKMVKEGWQFSEPTA